MNQKTLFNHAVMVYLIIFGLVLLTMSFLLEPKECGDITPEAISIEAHEER